MAALGELKTQAQLSIEQQRYGTGFGGGVEGEDAQGIRIAGSG
jgi:hypothetical protein